jgi:hypothetical protein
MMRPHLHMRKGNPTHNNNDERGGLKAWNKGKIGLKGTQMHER